MRLLHSFYLFFNLFYHEGLHHYALLKRTKWFRAKTAAGRVFSSSGDFKADMEVLDRKEADGWK